MRLPPFLPTRRVLRLVWRAQAPAALGVGAVVLGVFTLGLGAQVLARLAVLPAPGLLLRLFLGAGGAAASTALPLGIVVGSAVAASELARTGGLCGLQVSGVGPGRVLGAVGVVGLVGALLGAVAAHLVEPAAWSTLRGAEARAAAAVAPRPGQTLALGGLALAVDGERLVFAGGEGQAGGGSGGDGRSGAGSAGGAGGGAGGGEGALGRRGVEPRAGEVPPGVVLGSATSWALAPAEHGVVATLRGVELRREGLRVRAAEATVPVAVSGWSRRGAGATFSVAELGTPALLARFERTPADGHQRWILWKRSLQPLLVLPLALAAWVLGAGEWGGGAAWTRRVPAAAWGAALVALTWMATRWVDGGDLTRPPALNAALLVGVVALLPVAALRLGRRR